MSHLWRLAASLGIPTSVSTKKINQMIEGKLSETDSEATNVQVVIDVTDSGTNIDLEDEGAVFLTMAAAKEPPQTSSTSFEPEMDKQEEEDDVQTLHRKLEAPRGENEALKAEVSYLEGKVEAKEAYFCIMYSTI